MNVYLRKVSSFTRLNEEYLGSSLYYDEPDIVESIFNIIPKLPSSEDELVTSKRLGTLIDVMMAKEQLYLMDELDPEQDIVIVVTENAAPANGKFTYEYAVEIRDASYNGALYW